MTALERLKAGRPDEALPLLQDEVRRAPGDAAKRVFLFQLLCIEGAWARALGQLQTAAQLDPGAASMAHLYRDAIAAEALRRDVFTGRKTPVVMGEPPGWMAPLIEALRVAAAGDAEGAERLRDDAFAAAPGQPGTIDGRPFEWIADADPRLGPVLEAVVNGRYVWIPFERLAGFDVAAPEDLRDTVWALVTLTLRNGGQVPALVPARYPGSEASQDPAHRLGRLTTWSEDGWPTGQRMLATDAEEVPLLAARAVRFASDEAAEGG